MDAIGSSRPFEMTDATWPSVPLCHMWGAPLEGIASAVIKALGLDPAVVKWELTPELKHPLPEGLAPSRCSVLSLRGVVKGCGRSRPLLAVSRGSSRYAKDGVFVCIFIRGLREPVEAVVQQWADDHQEPFEVGDALDSVWAGWHPSLLAGPD